MFGGFSDPLYLFAISCRSPLKYQSWTYSFHKHVMSNFLKSGGVLIVSVAVNDKRKSFDVSFIDPLQKIFCFPFVDFTLQVSLRMDKHLV